MGTTLAAMDPECLRGLSLALIALESSFFPAMKSWLLFLLVVVLMGAVLWVRRSPADRSAVLPLLRVDTTPAAVNTSTAPAVSPATRTAPARSLEVPLRQPAWMNRLDRPGAFDADTTGRGQEGTGKLRQPQFMDRLDHPGAFDRDTTLGANASGAGELRQPAWMNRLDRPGAFNTNTTTQGQEAAGKLKQPAWMDKYDRPGAH